MIPDRLTSRQVNTVYATEADLLNVALFGITAREWREANSSLQGNMRDHANIHQLVCLANLESLNAHFIEQGLEQSERVVKLNKLAIRQMGILTANQAQLASSMQDHPDA